MNSLLNLDQDLFKFINHLSGIWFFDQLMLVISSYQLWLTVFFFWLIYEGSRHGRQVIKPTFGLAIAIGASDFLTFNALKPGFERLRPCHSLSDVELVQERCGGDFGFPSNHAANSGAALAFILIRYQRKVFWATAVLAFLVCLSRVYIGVHFPLDVLTGCFLGFCLGWLILTKLFHLKSASSLPAGRTIIGR